jgi:hypothetical protein
MISCLIQIWFRFILSAYWIAIRTVRGSNPGGGEIFRARPDLLWGPPSLELNGYGVSFTGVKRPGRGVDHPPPSSIDENRKSRAIPLLPLWAFKPVLRRTFITQELCTDYIVNMYTVITHYMTATIFVPYCDKVFILPIEQIQ